MDPLDPDSAWFAALVREHEHAIRATGLRLCGNAAEADDLFQETCLRGFQKRASYKQGTNFLAWILTILRNCFIDRFRSRSRERSADVSAEEVQERVAAPEQEAQPRWAHIGPEQLQEAVEKLPEQFRLVYQLHALEKRSYNEIAAQLGIPKDTVGTRLIRARRRLKELLLPTETGGDA
ncbi:RNA polymerase sigma factor [Hyalangium gracile]|uniref:RNA polymerase sigma factor n=1 Tax=Hyalangium gracile TaxID=394092 RepID=UPI001CCB87FF|nr:sigma-70 family RNA polymerase sigma factor [Hyalangium gracile]